MTRAKALLLLLLATVAFAIATTASANDRANSLEVTVKKLNGSPAYLGHVYSRDGTSKNNCTTTLNDAGTGGTFDAGKGDLVLTVCTSDQWMKTGTCATTATITDLPVPAGAERYTLLKTDQVAIAFRPQDGGTISGCGFWRME